MIDLHNHSTKSDGTYTPSELVVYAMEKGLSAFALTDHDTVDGLEEAISYADQIKNGSVPFPDTAVNAEGKDHPVVPEIIPGIEFSTEWNGTDIHVVGLFIDYKNEEFCKKLDGFIKSRDGRNEKMAQKLAGLGIGISYEGMLSMFPDCVLTRAHFARYLVEYGYVKSTKEAFERYLGHGCPGYVPREKVTPTQAVEMTLLAGGIPILAHPLIYDITEKQLESLICEMKKAGLVGIEALYCTHSASDERYVRGLASKYGLLISGGSDFHGENKPGLSMGTGYGSLYIPDDVLSALRVHKCST
ncbi:MAG: PHP domain-containing protein [Lachnospiraceae bacterium]|nr:PHP domain-containing protein [Lachnospiraceae bacterium]